MTSGLIIDIILNDAYFLYKSILNYSYFLYKNIIELVIFNNNLSFLTLILDLILEPNTNYIISYKVNYILLSIYFKGSFYFLLAITIIIILIFSFSKSKHNQNLNIESTDFLKILCLITFLVSMGLLLICLYFYLILLFNINDSILLSNIVRVKANTRYFSLFTFRSDYDSYINFDFFGTVIFLISYYVGFLSFLALDNKVFSKNIKYFFFLNLFIIIVFFFVTSNNILNIFLLYEFLLIPSFLLVFFLSPGRKSTQASLYFII